MRRTNTLEKVMEKRPEGIIKKLGAKSKVCLLDSHKIFNILKDKKVIIMACNIRIKHVIAGIMRAAEELDAIVAFELARSEGNVEGGYTGQTPQIFFDTVIGYAEKTGFSKPFFIHGDHITVKDTSEKEIETARGLIKTELEAGYTSFAIDASHNYIPDNVRITTELVRPIVAKNFGLEVEVGEIKAIQDGGEITSVEEAVTYIDGLDKNGIHPDLLAINNGSKHGNYKAGEEVHIHLDRTGEIYNAIKGKGICIAQHGITGTPLTMVGQFADYGIRKGNVGTEWQNIAHRHIPKDLMAEMNKWCDDNKKDLKFATKPFKAKIDSIPTSNIKSMEEDAYKSAKDFIKAFRAVGTAGMVIEALGK